MTKPPSHIKAILLALLVTFIWSTSWIFIKIGLEEIPPLTFAGLRYTLAFLVLIPFALRKNERTTYQQLTAKDWRKLILLGVVYYAMAQGGQFVALAFLPSITVSLILNMSVLFTAVFSIFTLREIPTWIQWVGVVMNVVGIFIFFFPDGFQNGALWGFIAAAVSLLANVFGAVLGRNMNKGGKMRPIPLTVISMGMGALLMLTSGAITQGIPVISIKSWGIIVLLAVVNTALSFTVWNYTLQTLTAVESAIINSTMLIQVSLLSWVFLGERVNLQEGMGLVLVALGSYVVQIRLNSRKRIAE